MWIILNHSFVVFLNKFLSFVPTGQFFHPVAGNSDLQFQPFPSEFSSSPESSFLSQNSDEFMGAAVSAILAVPTPPSDTRDDSALSTMPNILCKSEPHPSPTEQQQQQQQHNGTTWTPLTPPALTSISGF
jgi:hypothetical protein